jgi:hypothetical protein
MNYFYCIIAGSRTFNDYKKLKEFCDYILSSKTLSYRIVIISGTAKGADSLGERYAQECGYECLRFPADWNKHGRAAGLIRNEEMLICADGVIAFSVNHSSGTEHMIKIAKAAGKKVAVMRL